MPLRDHFRPPLDDETQWEGFHGGWPMMIVAQLAPNLPRRYVAAPRVHLGGVVEVDVATYEKDGPDELHNGGNGANGGVATAIWAPAQPTLALATDLPDLDDYEVRVYDNKRGRRLVAAVELVSPANKDRPEHRTAFVAKCLARLQNQVCVAIVDLVTTRRFNLYAELLTCLGQTDPSLGSEPSSVYAVTLRPRQAGRGWLLESWGHRLTPGESLPTLPLWLAENLAVPLDLETSYEETCRILRIPSVNGLI